MGLLRAERRTHVHVALGIVTRCPLVLKLRKLVNEDEWRGKISYLDLELEISEASKVEEEIRKGKRPALTLHTYLDGWSQPARGGGSACHGPHSPWPVLLPGEPAPSPPSPAHQASAFWYLLFFSLIKTSALGQNLMSVMYRLVSKLNV